MSSRDSFTSLSQEDMFEDEERQKEKVRPTPKPKPSSSKSFVNLPAVAVPEKILLVLDNSSDDSLGYLKKDPEPNTDPTVSAESVLKEALRLFISLKLNQPAAKDTEIAIVTLQPTKIVWQGFSSDKQRLMKELDQIGPEVSSNGEQINVTPIFNLVSNLVQIPEQPDKNIPPEFIVRVVFVYCNSYDSPTINTEDLAYVKFSTSSCCFLDVIYLHEKQSNLNNVEQIYKQLSELVSPKSYLLESSRNITNVYNQMAKLLAHPCQRAPQFMWKF